MMREGIYKIDYQGATGMGFALIVLETETVIGADLAGGIYDGSYRWNEQTQRLDVDVKVDVPEGSVSVMGVVAPPGGLKFGVRCSFPRDPDNQTVRAETDYGPILVGVHILRSFR